MKIKIAMLCLGALLLIIPGCASRRQLNKMETQLDYLEKSNANIEKKISELDSLYRAQEESQRQFLTRMEASISNFEERLNQLSYKLTDLTDMISQMERIGLQAQPVASANSEDSTADTTSQTTTAVDPNVIFNSAFRNLQAGNHEIAILSFSEYITSFPNTSLTDDAQYWLGECYYQKDPRDFQKAKVEFQKVLDNYPDSDRMAISMFKLARSLEELQETQDAIGLYRQIIEKFPETAEGNRARVQLEGLGEKVE